MTFHANRSRFRFQIRQSNEKRRVSRNEVEKKIWSVGLVDRTNKQKGSQVGERVARFRGRSPDGTADRPIFKFARYPFESGMQPTLSPRRMQPVQPYPSPSTDRSTIIRNWAKSDLRSRCTDSLTKGRHSRDRPDRKDGLSPPWIFGTTGLHCEKARLKFFQFDRLFFVTRWLLKEARASHRSDGSVARRIATLDVRVSFERFVSGAMKVD